MRINKYLAFRGVGSRRKCDEMIAAGRVSVNGRVVRELGTQIEEGDRVAVDGRPVGGRERHVYYVLNKPVGVITTLDDPQGRRTIREFLPRGARVYPVGRLDADTSGLLLLTNDGDLAHRLMHPRYGVPKIYRVRLGTEPRPDQLRRLGSGVRFDKDQVSGPAKVRRIDPGFDAIMIEVTIHEGRFRQVRKMCETVGLDVTGLHRVGYGPLRLGPMTRGMFRELSAEEVANLRAASARPEGRWAPAKGERPAKAGERPADASSEARRARRAAPAPKEAPVEEVAEGSEEEEEEDEATWVPGGGYVPRDGDEDEADDAAAEDPAPSSEWPARASGRRGDRDFRPSAGERPRAARPARESASAPSPRAGSRPRSTDRGARSRPADRGGRPRPMGRGDRPRDGERRERFSGPRERSGPPRERSGPSRERSGPPRERFSGGRERSGPPRERFGGPRERSGPPRERFGGPRERSGPPRERSGPRARPDDRGRPRGGPSAPSGRRPERSGSRERPARAGAGRGRDGQRPTSPSRGMGRRPGAGGFGNGPASRNTRNPSRRKRR